jgi:transcriptional regulator with XRE-family HTH domain
MNNQGVNNIMTKEDFKGIREFLNHAQFKGQKWTQIQLAAELTRSIRAIKYYESGEQEVPAIVANKMEILFHEACTGAISESINLLLIDVKTPEQYEIMLKKVELLKV